MGARTVELRELSLCGVTALPLGPRTRVTVRAGMLTLVIAGTSPPKRLPRAAVTSWGQRAAVAAVALGGALFAAALQVTAPRTPTWSVPDAVRVKVALMLPSLHGGREASSVRAQRSGHAAERASVVAPAASAAASPGKRVPNQDRAVASAATHTLATTPPAAARSSPASTSSASAASSTASVSAISSAPPASPAASVSSQRAARDRLMARALASADDARRAAAVQARAAGVVGALAQFRTPLLGDYLAASDAPDCGALAVGAGDSTSASGAATASAAGSHGSNRNTGDGSTGSTGSAGSTGSGAGGSGSGDGNGSGSDDGSGSGSGDGSGSGSGDGSGALAGDDVGDAYGTGGLGISGIGEGGGGAGDGTIGLGSIGTIGYGGGSGTGVGYGSGAGGLGGRRAAVPACALGRAEVRGSCDKDLIRRVVHAHLNELRFCYERVLQSRPELAGRVASRFVIGWDGRVTSSTIAASSLPPAVDQCVAQAIARWQFAPRCVGAVSYPILFEPIASAP